MTAMQFGRAAVVGAPATSWWAEAPRVGFCARCRAEWCDHMRGSTGDQMVATMLHLHAFSADGMPRHARGFTARRLRDQ